MSNNSENRIDKKKEQRKNRIKNSRSYFMIHGISRIMDRYYIDPIIGLLLPGWGDVFSSIFGFPYIYISLFKVRSIPLTLAVIFNILIDTLFSAIPLLGDLFDVFHRSYKKNLLMIIGYVEDDSKIISEVNKKAIWMAIGIVIMISIIYLIYQLVAFIFSWIISLF